MITISKEIMYRNLLERIETAFSLPEVCGVEIKEIYIKKNMDKECFRNLAERAVDCSFHDILSDIDMSVIIRKSLQDSVYEEAYVKRIDRFGFTEETCLGICYMNDSKIYRIVMKNGMRYDFGFQFVLAGNEPGGHPQDVSGVPACPFGGAKNCSETVRAAGELTRDEDADILRLQKQPKENANKRRENPNWPMENVNRFWFVQIQALAKLYRKDYLISDHLANMNLNETLVQQMVLRDLEYGTNFHRYGYAEELEYKKISFHECPYKKKDSTFNQIAWKLYAAAIAYDRLMKAFYPTESEKLQMFLAIWECYHAYSYS